MIRYVRALAVALCLLSFPVWLIAQTPPAKDDPQNSKPSNRKASNAQANPLADQRRTTAIALLTALADEARNYHDQTLRARVMARAADALWDSDTERARVLFRRAWEAADTADTESERRAEEDLRRQQQAPGIAERRNTPRLRNEVLRLVARHDRALGEEFLAKLTEAKERAATDAAGRLDNAPNSSESWNAPAAQEQRLRLAEQLLQEGNVERALQFADPALGQANRSSISFLCVLREKNAAEADKRFAALLPRAASDPASDANTVSLLSSYVFTPFLYITFFPDGGQSSNQRREVIAPPANFPTALRDAFLNVAAQILLRPLPAPDQDHTSSGRSGKYMVMARLLPLFEQYAPDRAAELHTQISALTPDVPEGMRNEGNPALTRGLAPEDTSKDILQDLQQRLDKAANASERDEIYANTAVYASHKGDPRTRELVDKIEDTELRKQVRAYVDFESIMTALNKKNGQEALRLVRTGELTHVQRAWAYTQTARLLIKSDPTRARELLEDAATEARRIGGGEADRPRALIAVATVFAEADRSRAWETAAEAVKAGNAANDFTGEDGEVGARVQTKNMIVSANPGVPDFNVLGLFRALGKEDIFRAVELAKGFTGEAPRAAATLAVASSALNIKDIRGQQRIENTTIRN